ncbi:TetR/AcrR family transcriptional regulator C-terminal domain-containing protein [Streptomyces sp. NPDC052114]|uniref:TetR/AcrR family transcriptional regulator n=1 Tax=unclassified Streptomyces TaxID=2593676 RepID=UPI00341539DD
MADEKAAKKETAEKKEAAAQGRRASDRGRYGRLSRERVLATALEVVDRDGLSGLSMRKLGAELGVEAMALYRYAAGKAALLDGLVEAFCQELEEELAAGPREADWQRELHRIALATHGVALRHPNMVPLLATRLLSTPLARRPAAVLRSDERVLALLHEAGMGERRTVRVHRAFTAWLLGYLLVELRAMDDEPGEPDPAFRLGLHRMPAREFPRLRATAIALDGRGGPRQLADGLDALLGSPLLRGDG